MSAFALTFPLETAMVTWLAAMVRIVVESSATLLVGILCAATIRCCGGYPAVQSWLGPPCTLERTFRIMGMCCCIPLCAFGVLPVAKELSDSGMPRRDLAVLWLVAPLLNPLSLLYAFSILPFWQCIAFLGLAFCFGVVVAEVADRFAVGDTHPCQEQTPPPTQGTTRLWNGAVAAGRIATGWGFLYIIAGIVISGLVVGLTPPSSLEGIFSRDNPAGPLQTTGIVAPQMMTPISFTMAVSAINRTHLMFACAIVLQLLGVAWCGSTVLAMRSLWGWQRTVALFCTTLLLAVAAGYGAYATSPPPTGEAEETHGLDTFARPIQASFALFPSALGQQLQHTDTIMRGGAVLLLLVVAWGVLVRAGKFAYREQPAAQKIEAAAKSSLNMELTPGQIGLVSLVGVAFCCVMVMYSVFPSVEESFEEMRNIQTDAIVAVKNSKTAEADKWLAQWDAVAARMPVGWAMRFGMPNADQASQIRQMRELLWNTRQQMREPRFSEAKARAQGDRLVEQFEACRQVCLGEQQ